MTCADVRHLLHVYADGELDPVRSLEVEEHLRTCPACSQACGRLRALRGVLAAEPLRYKAPPHVHKAIRTSLRAAERAETPPRLPWRLLAVAACLAVVALTTWWAVGRLGSAFGEDRMARAVVVGHLRSLMEQHLLDVPSSDRHTVKPWFRGKLDVAPPVPDLAGHDFTLLGGRLDYLDDRPVAAIVYSKRKHIINLFVWPEAAVSTEPVLTQWRGYHLVHWSSGGSTCWAVSDLNAAELQEFARLVQGS
jgi:anti-sigma factor RsiW